MGFHHHADEGTQINLIRGHHLVLENQCRARIVVVKSKVILNHRNHGGVEVKLHKQWLKTMWVKKGGR